MKTFFIDIIPKLKKYSKRLDDITLLTSTHWVMLGQDVSTKVVYIFRQKENQLLISQNSHVVKGTWEYLGNDTILIERQEESFLLRHGFLDNRFLALKIDGKDEYAFFISETILKEMAISSINQAVEYLERFYLAKSHQQISDGNIKIRSSTYSLESKPEDVLDAIFNPNSHPDLVLEVRELVSSPFFRSTWV